MLKYFDYSVTFSEFPDEISLCVNISNCPNKCEKCSESWLSQDVGFILNDESISDLIKKNPGITLFGFMGGDNDPIERARLSVFIKEKFKIKTGVYSGSDSIYLPGIETFDYYKYGRWIYPFDKSENLISDKQCGPICYTGTNQKMFEIKNGKMIDITYKFHKNKISNLKNFVVEED